MDSTDPQKVQYKEIWIYNWNESDRTVSGKAAWLGLRYIRFGTGPIWTWQPDQLEYVSDNLIGQLGHDQIRTTLRNDVQGLKEVNLENYNSDNPIGFNKKGPTKVSL